MSILIKGVTMPKNCFDCPMAFAVDFGILCTPTHYIVGDAAMSGGSWEWTAAPAEEPTHSNASNTLNALREEGE